MNIQLNNLTKHFAQKCAINIPQCTIQTGEIIGLEGNNGAGKTTLFRLLLDLLKADSGQVLYTTNNNDTNSTTTIDPSKTETWKQFTGAYIDHSFLIDFLTPQEYFAFIAKINHITTAQLNNTLTTYNNLMNEEILTQKKLIRDFSAGNQQKIGIIAALIAQPQLLILDEPFNFLDPSSQSLLKKILLQYQQTTNATILISSHNLQHTIEISTRIILLENGKIIKDLPNKQQEAKTELQTYFN